MAKWAFLFPGQGSQYVGMGKDLKDNFKVAADVFAEADEALSDNLSKMCFEGPESDLKLTMNTQPAILTASIASLKVLQQETGIEPAIVVARHGSLPSGGGLWRRKLLSRAELLDRFHRPSRSTEGSLPSTWRPALAASGAR